MDFQIISQTDSVDKMKCCQCKNYLSYFPISICPNNGDSCCGRCALPNGTSHIQNVAFEQLCKFMRFPCRYNTFGCTTELFPKAVPEHERSCKYHPVACPLDANCTWLGPHSATLHHCQTQHDNLFLKEGIFNLDLSKFEESTSFIVHKNVLFVFERMFDPEKELLRCSLSTCKFQPNSRQFSCELKVDDNDGKRLLLQQFDSGSFDEKNQHVFALGSLMSEDVVNCQVSIKERIGTNVMNQEKTNSDLLAVLECINCSQFATPPIFCCTESGGTLCEICISTHKNECRTCSQNETPMRNYNLDNIAALLDYPCRNRHKGCCSVSKPDQIKKHQLDCEYGDLNYLECPFNEFEPCPWKNIVKYLSDHIRTDHQEIIPNSSEIFKHVTTTLMCDVIAFANRLFRLVYTKRNDRFMWAVQVIGSCPKNTFGYEMEVTDCSKSGRKLMATEICSDLTRIDQVFAKGSSFCWFREDQMTDFMYLGGYITFKVRIFYMRLTDNE